MGRIKVLRADRLRRARLGKGYSQEELQERVGLGANQVSRYERSESDPSPEMLVKLAQELGVSIDWLLGLVDEPNARLSLSDLTERERRLITAYRSREFQEVLRIIANVAHKNDEQ